MVNPTVCAETRIASARKGDGHEVLKEEDVCFDVYSGSAESLVSAGIVTASQLPGSPGAGKTMMTFRRGVRYGKGYNLERDEHYMQISRLGRGGFKVCIGLKKEEEDRRRAKFLADRERLEQQESAAEERQKVAKKLAYRCDPASLRKHTVWAWSLFVQSILDHLVGAEREPDSGEPAFLCTLRPADAEERARVLGELRHLRDWLRDVRIEPGDALLLAARSDDAFQQFLQGQCLED